MIKRISKYDLTDADTYGYYGWLFSPANEFSKKAYSIKLNRQVSFSSIKDGTEVIVETYLTEPNAAKRDALYEEIGKDLLDNNDWDESLLKVELSVERPEMVHPQVFVEPTVLVVLNEEVNILDLFELVHSWFMDGSVEVPAAYKVVVTNDESGLRVTFDGLELPLTLEDDIERLGFILVKDKIAGSDTE